MPAPGRTTSSGRPILTQLAGLRAAASFWILLRHFLGAPRAPGAWLVCASNAHARADARLGSRAARSAPRARRSQIERACVPTGSFILLSGFVTHYAYMGKRYETQTQVRQPRGRLRSAAQLGGARRRHQDHRLHRPRTRCVVIVSAADGARRLSRSTWLAHVARWPARARRRARHRACALKGAAILCAPIWRDPLLVLRLDDAHAPLLHPRLPRALVHWRHGSNRAGARRSENSPHFSDASIL